MHTTTEPPTDDQILQRLHGVETVLGTLQTQILELHRTISRSTRMIRAHEVMEKAITQIQDVISRYYEIDIQTLTSRKRQEHIVWPRHIAIYLCRKTTKASLHQIAKRFRDRDHSTILYAVAHVEERIATNPAHKSEIQEWLNKFTTPNKPETETKKS